MNSGIRLIEVTQPGYPPEKRPLPKAEYKLVHQAVAQAVAHGDIWLVFGNESILGEKPTEIQLDPDAYLFRPPARLRAMDLLPGALPTAWNGTPAKTTIGKLYAELKAEKKRPWPTRQFLEVLNEAVNQGVVVRVASGPELSSLLLDSDRELQIPATKPTSTTTTTSSPGGKETGEVTLDLAQLQEFTDSYAPALTKILAGTTPKFSVRIKLSGKTPADLSKANEILAKIKPDWRF